MLAHAVTAILWAQVVDGTPVQEGPRTALSARGLSGLINVPTATTVPDGRFELGYNIVRDREAFPRVDRQRNFSVAVGLLPRLTLSGRGVDAVDTSPGHSYVASDLSVSAQVLVLKEGSWWPAFAVGAQDIGGGAQNFRSYFGVLSKSFFGRLRVTAGVGRGPDELKGVFGGAELEVNRFVTILSEYDGHTVTPALRLFPFPEQWEAHGVPRPAIDLAWQQGSQLSWGLTLRAPLAGMKQLAQSAPAPAPETPAPLRHERRAPSPPVSPAWLARELQAELVDRGFENVRVTFARSSGGSTVIVEYENRRFNRDELDALGIVLGLALLRTPAEVTRVRAIVVKGNLPVLDVSTSADALLAFLDDAMSNDEFGRQLRLTQDGAWVDPTASPYEATTNIAERSWGKFDVFLRPRLGTQVLTDVGILDVRGAVLPEVQMQLLPGMAFDAQAEVPIVRTSGYIDPLLSPGVERVLVHQALPIPIGRLIPGTAGFTQASVGRFTRDDVGIVHETGVTLFDGIGFLKGTWARVGPTFVGDQHLRVLGNARVRCPALDLKLSVTGGRFLDGDRGAAGDLSRFFGDTEVGVFLRHTENGSQAGVRIALPLTPSKELPPWRVRPRLPDVHTQDLKTTVFTSLNTIQENIGRELDTGHPFEGTYWNRDRLYPAYIRHHVGTLRDAVRTWVDVVEQDLVRKGGG